MSYYQKRIGFRSHLRTLIIHNNVEGKFDTTDQYDLHEKQIILQQQIITLSVCQQGALGLIPSTLWQFLLSAGTTPHGAARQNHQ